MSNRTNRTPKKDTLFFAHLAKAGMVGAAAQAAGYSRTQLYQWRKDDTDFACVWDEALDDYVEALEAEADRRAKDGVLKPVFYMGEIVGEIPQYSDNLLMFRLKALRPEKYRERSIPLQSPTPPTKAAPEPQIGKRPLSAAALRQIKRDVYGLHDDDADVD